MEVGWKPQKQPIERTEKKEKIGQDFDFWNSCIPMFGLKESGHMMSVVVILGGNSIPQTF